jgi:hypothetical protein
MSLGSKYAARNSTLSSDNKSGGLNYLQRVQHMEPAKRISF